MLTACQNAGQAGLLGGMSLEECTRRGQQLGIHILVVAYRSTAHYSIKAQQNRCLVRWASQAQRIGTFDSCETQFAWMVFKKLFTLLDLCVSSLRRGHANLLCIVPILTDDPRRESKCKIAARPLIGLMNCGYMKQGNTRDSGVRMCKDKRGKQTQADLSRSKQTRADPSRPT